MEDINRIAWGAIFMLGVAVFAWMEWQDNNGLSMVWFMLTSFWSAACGIGYTIVHWFIGERDKRRPE